MKTLRIVAITTIAALWLSSGTADAQAIDEAFRADVESLLEATGALNLGAQMASIVSDQTIDAAKKAQPDIPDRAVALIKEVLNAEFAAAFTGPNGMRGQMVALYAKHFTHPEVKDLATFYRSDIGRKSISVMPLLASEGAAIGQQWSEKNMARVMGVLEQRLRAEGFIK